ncbi:hypothetical protein BEN48_14520 [Hymenobacter glacialis]|uniref:Uncharacterized protein n=1 Tax=Hymenobacter glacialis TaxID=1908236 RepID=A0A1G1T3C2_9BACT|nr:hypothetical protein BEN48_14520 [Hymenobacter glacialis]
MIYAKKNNVTYKIVSDKAKSAHCTAIKAGQNYNFDLTSLYSSTAKAPAGTRYVPTAMAGNLGSKGIDWDGKGTIITLEGDSIRDIFFAKNVVGLCLK